MDKATLQALIADDDLGLLDLLDKSSFYMNPASGTVDSGKEWLIAYESRDMEDFPTWNEWGGCSLIEVVFDESEQAWKEKE